MTQIINIYAGPGAGKSTTAAGLFHRMKSENISCELVTEFAKDVVWEGTVSQLRNQLWVFANQHNRIFKLLGKVDYIITDSPLLLSTIYGPESEFYNPELQELIIKTVDSMNNRNFFLLRSKPFHQQGRLHDESEALELDKEILDMLSINGSHFRYVESVESLYYWIFQHGKNPLYQAFQHPTQSPFP